VILSVVIADQVHDSSPAYQSMKYQLAFFRTVNTYRESAWSQFVQIHYLRPANGRMNPGASG